MLHNAPLLERITQEPLLIDAGAQDLFQSSIRHIVGHEHGAKMLDAAASVGTGDDFWPEAGSWMERYRPYTVKDGLLQIPIMGVLLNRFPFQFGRWATGYTYVEKALERGLADPEVRGIALLVDSPGGEVAGCFELTDKLHAARSEKPIRSFASDHAYSAAYSLASAGETISVTRSGGVGSIGVVTAHVEYSEMLKDVGIKVTFIFAGKHKIDGNAYEKLPENVKSRLQERINRIYGVFTSTVARNRGMDEEKVKGTEALTYDAKDGIEIGLADRLGSLEDEMAIFQNEVASGDDRMATEQKDMIDKATHETAVATARAEGVAEGTKTGASAERQRINAILASNEGKARPKAAMSLAMKTGLSLEEATASLADMPEEKAPAASTETAEPTATQTKTNHFNAAMANGNPEVGGGESGGEETEASASESILADFAAHGGYTRNKSAA